ncbi:MAG TPA: hypothetical protein VFA97_13915 [Gaiellaceae bacterium]|nr:hypothetical protein [Gaiellaceae bacterium]
MRRLVLLAIVGAALWGAPGAFAAGWCGTGESATDLPDVVTGPQIHAIYAIPSDGTDSFAAGAPLLADDIASITTWWQGQDPTRVPRFDNASFNGTTCTDISFVRLPDPASKWADMGAGAAFALISSDLFGLGFDNPYKKYYVYFDGPSVEADVCGTGAGTFESGPSYAVVWLGGCSDVPTDAIGAHELLHALGALPAGAPNACTAKDNPLGAYADPGHPCDSPTDVLYPVTTGAPLSSLVLDYDHDDYYAHSGSWIDIQDSPWLHLLDAPQFPIAVAIDGAGTVESDQPGLDCTSTCTTQWDQGAQVTLSALATRTTHFVSWHGACTGGTPTCSVTADAAQPVSAVFGPARISVTVSTTGQGHVLCAPACSSRFVAGTSLTLRAVSAKGWRFVRWSGACKGTRPTCIPTTNYAFAAHASFAKLRAKPKKKKPTER